MKSATPFIKKPVIQALVMESPLRDSIPHHMIQYASLSSHNKGKSPSIKTGASPLNGLSYSRNDTAGKLYEAANNLASKRQINFDEAHEGTNIESNKRKLKFTQVVMDKIVEQNAEEAEVDSIKKSKFLFY